MEVRCLQTRQDKERVAQFVATLFHGRFYWQAYADFRQLLDGDPAFRPEFCRFVEEKGEILAHVLMVRREMTVAGVPLVLGGLGYVGTHPKARRRGLARRLIEQYLEYMAAHGYDLAGLFGIPDYYQRFGFAAAFPVYWTEVAARRLGEVRGRGPSPRAVSHIPRRDLPGLASVFASFEAGRTGAIARSPEYWAWSVKRWRRTLIARGSAGDIRGYAVVGEAQDGALPVLEIAAEDEYTTLALLAASGKAAEQQSLPAVRLLVPPGHPAARLAYRRLDGEHHEALPKDRGGQLKVIAPERLGEKLAPALARRVAGSRFGSAAGRVEVATESGRFAVALPGGASGQAGFTLRLPLSLLAGLLVGSTEFPDLLAEPGVEFRPHAEGGAEAARELGGVVFPADRPFIWNTDRF
ncbi:MAG: GNAT family N-acetyltransferase [Methanocella sp.]